MRDPEREMIADTFALHAAMLVKMEAMMWFVVRRMMVHFFRTDAGPWRCYGVVSWFGTHNPKGGYFCVRKGYWPRLRIITGVGLLKPLPDLPIEP